MRCKSYRDNGLSGGGGGGVDGTGSFQPATCCSNDNKENLWAYEYTRCELASEVCHDRESTFYRMDFDSAYEQK